MAKILPPRYRYPLFFLGLFIMELSGLFFKFLNFALGGVETMIVVGFLIFAFSIIST